MRESADAPCNRMRQFPSLRDHTSSTVAPRILMLKILFATTGSPRSRSESLAFVSQPADDRGMPRCRAVPAIDRSVTPAARSASHQHDRSFNLAVIDCVALRASNACQLKPTGFPERFPRAQNAVLRPHMSPLNESRGRLYAVRRACVNGPQEARPQHADVFVS